MLEEEKIRRIRVIRGRLHNTYFFWTRIGRIYRMFCFRFFRVFRCYKRKEIRCIRVIRGRLQKNAELRMQNAECAKRRKGSR